MIFLLKSLTWFGRDCDNLLSRSTFRSARGIEVVDLVWKGLRHSTLLHGSYGLSIEVVDLVWKGLRQALGDFLPELLDRLKSLTWFGRDCDTFHAAPPIKAEAAN